LLINLFASAPLRAAVSHVKSDLEEKNKPTMLASIVEEQGGRYRGSLEYNDTVTFSVYTNVRFGNITMDRRGLASTLVFDTPPGIARNATAGQRVAFWERMGSKWLMPGTLVALIWRTHTTTSIYLGVIASSAKDLIASARASATELTIRVVFFNSAIEARILDWYQREHADFDETRVLVKPPIMYEAVRPFLEGLKAEPTGIPFSKYLVLREGSLANITVDPPRYTTKPHFSWDLSSLLRDKQLRLNVKDPASIANACAVLRNEGSLDPTQARAIVDSLAREVSLIQGPPGTGKVRLLCIFVSLTHYWVFQSYIAMRLLEVLIKNNMSCIIIIAPTDHALDRLLGNVLDAGITNRMVRLGSRSEDERSALYSLDAMERTSGNRMLGRTIYEIRRQMKDIEEEFDKVVATLTSRAVDSEDLLIWLDVHHPGQSHALTNPPKWVNLLGSEMIGSETATGGRKGKRAKNTAEFNQTEYGFWVNGLDLDFLETPVFPGRRDAGGQGKMSGNRSTVPGTSGDDQGVDGALSQAVGHQENLRDRFVGYELVDRPQPPTHDRSLDTLIHCDDVWDMSRSERLKLGHYWESSALAFGFESDVGAFKDLKCKHAELQQKLDDYNADVSGCIADGVCSNK
jgi:hypothetical protein